MAEIKDNPKLGIIYYCMAGVMVSINLMSSKVLYENHPELSGSLFIMFRSAISVIILGAYHNTQVKEIMYDSVDPGSMVPLFARIISGNFGIYVGLTAVKFFPLTMISMIMNCAPIISLCFVGVLLGEIVTINQIASVFIAMFGIGLMMLGGD